MKLADLNQNNIKLGYGRNTNGSFETAAPTSFNQSDKINIDSQEFEDEDELETDSSTDGIKKDTNKLTDVISMSNSWAPKRNLPDIRKPPNTSNIQ